MLKLRENRDKLIQRVLSEVSGMKDSTFDFEPEDILESLFESKEFNDTKFKRFKEKKLETSERNSKSNLAFFPNVSSYIKEKGNVNERNDKNTKS